MTNQEIKSAAFRLLSKIVTLDYNVKNGCRADRAELEKQLARLEGLAKWAKDNNMVMDIKHWFANKSFVCKFSASKICTHFLSI